MLAHTHRARAPRPGRPRRVRDIVLLVVALGAVVLAGCSTTAGPVASAPTTTPLGCPAGLPSIPLAASELQLECTERALISRVCDVRVDEDLQRVAVIGTAPVRMVNYRGLGQLQDAHFSYSEAATPNATVVDLICDTPSGGTATKHEQVQLTAEDWAAIAAAGTVLPQALQPANLELHRSTPPSTLAPAPTVLTPDPAGDACAGRASAVFRRLAAGQLTLAQARAQLPAKVPASALTSELEGVKRLEAEGASAQDAIDQASGTVAQSCEY